MTKTSIEEARERVALAATRAGELTFAAEVRAGAWDERNDVQAVVNNASTVLRGERFWMGDVGPRDALGDTITNEFIDGKSKANGLWGIFTPTNWARIGCDQLGTGFGQRYKRLEDGRWLKVEG